MSRKRFPDFPKKTGQTELKETKNLMKTLLSSDIISEIVLLFRARPQLILTKADIAARIEKKSNMIDLELNTLVELGLLERKKIGKRTWFISDTKKDKELQDRIEDYFSSMSQNS